MIKFIRDNVMYIFIVVLVCIFMWAQHSVSDAEDRFHERVRRDEAICIERARRDKKDYSYCEESSDAAQLAFDMAVLKSDDNTRFYVFFGLIFIIFAGIKTQKKIDELKKKIDV